MTVHRAGDAVAVRAPSFTFIKGDPLARLNQDRASFLAVTSASIIGADTDGYFQMTILSPDRIEMCYAHNGLSPSGSMVATCYVMERAKK